MTVNKLPDLPNYFDMRWCDEGGGLSVDAQLFMDDFVQTLNQLVTWVNALGIAFPQKTGAEITSLSSEALNGTVWYDTDDDKLKLKTPSGIKEIQSV